MKNFLAGSVALAGLSVFSSAALAGVEVGEKAPPLSPKSMEGGPIRSVEELKGKVVLVEFFAFW